MLAAICPSEMCGIERRHTVYLPRKSRPATSIFTPAMAVDHRLERPRTEYAVGKLRRETFVTGDLISARSSDNVAVRNTEADEDDYFHFISTMYSNYSIEQSRRSKERRRETALPITRTSINDSDMASLHNLVRTDRRLGEMRKAHSRNRVPRPALQLRKRSSPVNTTSYALRNLDQTLATDSDSDASLCRVNTAPARSHRATKSMIAAGSRSPKLTIGSITSHPSSMNSPRSSTRFPSAPCSPSDQAPPNQIDQAFDATLPRSSLRTPRSPLSIKHRSLKQEPEPIVQPLPQSHFSDDSSTEADFITEFRSSSIAAYLQNEDNRVSTETISQVKQPEQTTDIFEAPELTPDAGQTCWFSDTEAEDLPAPAIPPQTPHDIIYWSPAIAEDASAGAISIESSEKEDWPLPSPYPRSERRLPSAMAPLPIETTSQQHKHTLSSETTATIISPTFTEHRNSVGHDSASSFEISTPTAETHKPLEVQDDNASIAPSEMSVQWTQSPKERLGLGGRMRKSAVVPWEQEKSPTVTARRIDTSLVRTKSNRFSAFISRHRTLTG